MDNVGKMIVATAVIVPATTIINLALGAISVIVFYFLFKTAYRKWIEKKVVEFAEEVGEEANKNQTKG